MSEQFARVGELDICFETFGDSEDPAILLIMGLGTQMVAWHDDFCTGLAGRGYFVVRHDNRDIGRSTHLSQFKAPSLLKLAKRDRDAPYTLADMAGDSIGVLDHLGIEKAHIVGASMGGMIAQTVAIRHPERALSLVSIFSNTGGFFTGQPALTMYAVLLRPAPRERERFINHAVTMFEKIGGKGYESGVEDLTAIATRSYDRGGDPAGPSRQPAAIGPDRPRAPARRRLNLPATVIHGTDDKLVRPSGGRTTARAIPGARLVEIEGMGHGLPRGAWPVILDAIEDTTRRAEPAPVRAARG